MVALNAASSTPVLKSDLRGIETVSIVAVPRSKPALKSDLRGIETELKRVLALQSRAVKIRP